MNNLFHWVGFILVFEAASVTGLAEPSEQTRREASATFLRAVIGDVLQNPDAAKYFPGVKAEGISLNQQESGGRFVRWEYSHDVRYVPADPGMQVAFKPVFESGAGIIFSVFVANEQHGHGLFPWVKSYNVSGDSRLVAGFDLETGGDSGELQKEIDAIMRSHLMAFQKAVTAP